MTSIALTLQNLGHFNWHTSSNHITKTSKTHKEENTINVCRFCGGGDEVDKTL